MSLGGKIRSQEAGGLRLNYDGMMFLMEKLELQTYEIPKKKKKLLIPSNNIFGQVYRLSHYITNPSI